MALANQFDLKPKGVVYVDNAGLAKFNRTLDLPLSSINTGSMAEIKK
jgi:polysaccharide export outer membrane protein